MIRCPAWPVVGLIFIFSPFARAEESFGVKMVMAAPLSVRLYGTGNLDALRDRVFSRAEELDRELSSFRRDSDISRVNLQAPRAVRVSSDALACLSLAVLASRRTGGAFNPLVGSVMKARGRLPDFATARPEGPALLDIAGLEIDTAASTVRLSRPGMWLDLGGIGKGFALKEAAAVVAGKVAGAAFDFGGQLHFIGRAPKTGFWPVVISDPRTDRVLWAGRLREGSLSSSAQTDKPGHIVDPRRGWPRGPGGPPGRVLAVVWGRDPAWADALSTAVFLMDRQEALRALGSGPERAFLIEGRKGEWLTGPP